MDTYANSPKLINMQTQLRFFYDSAFECNNLCISNFDSKNLNDTERECVENCFTKQK